jgi:hypothetical protein
MNKRTIGIMGAMPEEIEGVVHLLSIYGRSIINGPRVED